ncbi:hypothetical protein [Micromonospora sp. CA-111912]|uniref:hypothetical protein n=1 Tax=Micromonospora sp. CA-111912 TaxID=3239955 RepID=UPI003D91A286
MGTFRGAGGGRRSTVEHVVPELRETSRCDGAVVYEWPDRRPAARAMNQRAEADRPKPLGGRNRRWQP